MQTNDGKQEEKIERNGDNSRNCDSMWSVKLTKVNAFHTVVLDKIYLFV
jgi:hypothetical protein